MSAKIKYNHQVGDIVGKCIYIAEAGHDMSKNQKERCCIFKCPYCENEFRNKHSRVKNLSVVSCGCYALNVFGKKYKTHGMSHTPEFKTWQGIMQRCYNHNNIRYENYGGRGIEVCKDWRDSFEAFYRDMGNKPSSKHSIDRIDVNGDYELSNCRWLSNLEQQSNKTNNLNITFESRTLTLAQWSREVGIKAITLRSRINKGWELNKCLSSKKFNGCNIKNVA